jgi:CDP-4-dehydro-6-deoxyglucose reductase, E1
LWSKWLGCKYSVFVNSGSSANLAAIYSLILSGRLKNNKIIVPAVSWVTTVTPAIQLGLDTDYV